MTVLLDMSVLPPLIGPVRRLPRGDEVVAMELAWSTSKRIEHCAHWQIAGMLSAKSTQAIFEIEIQSSNVQNCVRLKL